MAKPIENNINSINLLVSKTEVKGEISSDGDFRIDGSLIGNIAIKGKLVVGHSGKIEGNILCQSADFSGEVSGNVNVKELLVLQASSRINGDICIGKLSVEPGAVFTGKCQMQNAIGQTKPKSE